MESTTWIRRIEMRMLTFMSLVGVTLLGCNQETFGQVPQAPPTRIEFNGVLTKLAELESKIAALEQQCASCGVSSVSGKGVNRGCIFCGPNCLCGPDCNCPKVAQAPRISPPTITDSADLGAVTYKVVGNKIYQCGPNGCKVVGTVPNTITPVQSQNQQSNSADPYASPSMPSPGVGWKYDPDLRREDPANTGWYKMGSPVTVSSPAAFGGTVYASGYSSPTPSYSYGGYSYDNGGCATGNCGGVSSYGYSAPSYSYGGYGGYSGGYSSGGSCPTCPR